MLIQVDLELLRPLVVDDSINLKIIHLVRDPRGSTLGGYACVISKNIVTLMGY